MSDQLYDTTERHDEIRQTVVWYLRANREQFEPFVPLDTEDLVRSQPNTRSSQSRRASAEDPYEAYLENMAKPKTWGGEVEIRAFSEAYDRDVLIHRPTDAGQPFDQMVNNKRAAGQPRQFVHVSFGVSTLCVKPKPQSLTSSRESQPILITSQSAQPSLLRQLRAIPPPHQQYHCAAQPTTLSLCPSIAPNR